MDQTKPHKGRLDCWFRSPYFDGYTIVGYHLDHRLPAGHFIETSLIVSREGNEIETMNSRYTLLGEEKDLTKAMIYEDRMPRGRLH